MLQPVFGDDDIFRTEVRDKVSPLHDGEADQHEVRLAAIHLLPGGHGAARVNSRLESDIIPIVHSSRWACEQRNPHRLNERDRGNKPRTLAVYTATGRHPGGRMSDCFVDAALRRTRHPVHPWPIRPNQAEGAPISRIRLRHDCGRATGIAGRRTSSTRHR